MKTTSHYVAKSILVILSAVGVGLTTARADIWLDYCRASGDPNGYANVAYNTGGGVNQIVEQDGATVSYAPDGDPGHYFFTAAAHAPGGNMVTTTVDETTGIIRGSTVSIDEIAPFGNLGDDFNNYFYDTVTFHNTSPNPLAITVRLHVEGTISASASNPDSASGYYHADLDFGAGGAGGGLDLEGEKHTNGNPGENYDIYNVSGWDDPGDSYQISPAGPGLYGWDFTGTTTIQPGDTTLYLTSRLIELAQASGPPSTAATSFTSRLRFDLPPGVTFTSESGHLFTRGTPRARPTPHPRPNPR